MKRREIDLHGVSFDVIDEPNGMITDTTANPETFCNWNCVVAPIFI